MKKPADPPARPELVSLLAAGRDALGRGLYTDAIDCYHQALAHGATPSILNNLAIAQLYAGQMVAARESLKNALELAPQSADLWFNLGLVQRGLPDLPGALESFGRALEYQPRHLAARYQRGVLLIQLGHYADSLEQLVQIPLEEVPPVRARERTRPRVLMTQREAASPVTPAEGPPVADLQVALAEVPEQTRVLLQLGLALEKLGRRSEALDRYRQVRQLEPEWVEGALALATFFAQARPRVPEQREEAIRTLKAVLEQAGTQVESCTTEVARAWFLLATLHDDDPQGYPEAIAAYERGLALMPNFAVAHNNLGALFLKLGEVARAREHLERALQLDPRSRNVHGNLARLLYTHMSQEQGASLFDRLVATGNKGMGQGLFGVAFAVTELTGREAYRDFYSRGHQVKNRVGMTASGLKRLARQATEEGAAPSLTHKLEAIAAEQQELYDLLARMLLIVRPEDLTLSWVDPKPSLRGLVGRLRTANRGRARIRLRIDANVPRIRVDAARMAEALTNLVQNAVEALSERYGEDSGAKGVVDISCGLTADRRDVVFAVEDNGPGIPATSLNEVFRAGFTTKSAGSGLGLAITRRIIADHGGVLEVDGRAGRGARFVVRLALDAEARVSQSSTWMLPVLLGDPEALLVDELA